jgi:CubicO group peptidase (beta-lactamase class C family)
VTGPRREPPPERYEIRVRGRLGDTMRSAFPALDAHPRGADTVLTGELADQAALYGRARRDRRARPRTGRSPPPSVGRYVHTARDIVSASKTFTSVAVGIAEDEGLLDVAL